jgi:hypothetical protein
VPTARAEEDVPAQVLPAALQDRDMVKVEQVLEALRSRRDIPDSVAQKGEGRRKVPPDEGGHALQYTSVHTITDQNSHRKAEPQADSRSHTKTHTQTHTSAHTQTHTSAHTPTNNTHSHTQTDPNPDTLTDT